MKRLLLSATIFGLLTLASGSVGASSLTLNFSGEFTSTSTLGGTALGADNAFSYTATFDTTTGISKGLASRYFRPSQFSTSLAS